MAHEVPHGGSAATDYRADIDGLRAVAVLGVLAFHLDLIGGGYVGVDIFFVISGFLITRILIKELATGSFGRPQLMLFFERRIRRILPALAAMSVATMVASFLLLFPHDLKEYGRSLQAVAVFISNIHFQRKTGYFDGVAESQPLLHTWSLGVEEQYYLLFPPILWAAWRWSGRRGAALACFAVAAASLVYAELPSTAPIAFFSTPARIWELLAGSLLAFAQKRFPVGRILRESMALAGALLIAWTYACYTPATTFPGLGAVPPVAAAALLIAAGAMGPTLVSRLLATDAFVWIGVISYSVYLWHWPLIIFAKYRFAPYPDHLAETITAALVAGSLLLGYLSWRFIEQPFRRAGGPLRQTRAFTTQVALSLCMLTIGSMLSKYDGMPGRWPSDVLAVLSPQASVERARCKEPVSEQFEEIRTCASALGKPPSRAVLLWGDSHAGMVEKALSAHIDKDRVLLSAVSAGCPPLLGVELGGQSRSDRCQERNDRVLEYLRLHPRSVSTVVLAARWAFYAEGTRMPFEHGRRVILGSGDPADAHHVLTRHLGTTVTELSKYADRIVILAPFPEFDRPVAESLARERAWGLATLTVQSADAVAQRQKAALEAIRSAVELQPSKVEIASPLPHFCDSTHCAFANAEGLPLFGDTNHLNSLGLDRIDALLARIAAPPPAALPVTPAGR